MAGTSHSKISVFEPSFLFELVVQVSNWTITFYAVCFQICFCLKNLAYGLHTSNLRESIMATNQVTRETPFMFTFICSILYGMCFEASFWWDFLGKLGSQAIFNAYHQQPSWEFYTLKDKQTNKQTTLIDLMSNKKWKHRHPYRKCDFHAIGNMNFKNKNFFLQINIF